jgi:hypothetical protein
MIGKESPLSFPFLRFSDKPHGLPPALQRIDPI